MIGFPFILERVLVWLCLSNESVLHRIQQGISVSQRWCYFEIFPHKAPGLIFKTAKVDIFMGFFFSPTGTLPVFTIFCFYTVPFWRNRDGQADKYQTLG